MATNTISRSLHDIGLAAWFGGTLANAVALNPAAAAADSAAGTGAVANVGWNRWTPVNAAAIGAHLLGSIGQLSANTDRIGRQDGVQAMVVTKSALTVAALGATAYSRVLGRKISANTSVPAESGTSPHSSTPSDVADAQKKLALLQWVIPGLTGVLVVVSAYAGEQQRAGAVGRGMLHRVIG